MAKRAKKKTTGLRPATTLVHGGIERSRFGETSEAIFLTQGYVYGTAESAEEESFSRGLLEYPHYTRPREWAGREVPEALLSGHHGRVAAWRLAACNASSAERK